MFSDHLKTIRTQKGYSQELLAEKSGLSLRTIQRVENGETQPRGDTFMRITKALDVNPNEIMEWRKKDNKTYLMILNLSALSFVLSQLLAIILPLVLWLTKIDQIKGVKKIGKELLNFQITWATITYVFLQPTYFFFPSMIQNISWIIGAIFILNLAVILFNVYRIAKGENTWYYPRINLIR